MKFFLTLSFLFVFMFIVSAQPFGPRFPTPLGFVEILIGAGAIFGSKKLMDSKKDNNSD